MHSEKEADDARVPVTDRGQVAVILSPAKVASVGQFKHVVNAMALENGWSVPQWYLTTVEDPGHGVAAEAVENSAELVIVCGGDGTVREVAGVLAGTGVAIGVVAAGTGNLLARNLGLPLYMRSAIEVALTGENKTIDLVQIKGDGVVKSHFLVMTGMGFDAAMIEGVSDDLKARVGWLAYVVSGVRALRFPVQRYKIKIDDGEWVSYRARTVVVGNVGFLQAGVPLLPDAVIDDGLLDVVLIYPRYWTSWLALALRIVGRDRRSDAFLHRMQGTRVKIKTKKEIPREVDGDLLPSGRRLSMRIKPGALVVRVPVGEGSKPILPVTEPVEVDESAVDDLQVEDAG